MGEQWDPNAGFYYNRARWYVPTNGRFTTVDPHRGKIGIPISLHRYLYSKQNPVNYSDPSGRFFGFSTLSINSTIETSMCVAAQAEYMGLIKYLIVRQAIGTIITVGVAAEIGWDIYKQQKWISEAKNEKPLRLQHHTTTEGKNAIEAAGYIRPSATSGKSWYTPNIYSSSADATDRLTTWDDLEWYISLNMFIKADILSPQGVVAPEVYDKPEGKVYRSGGGLERTSPSPIFINALLRVRSQWIPLTE